MLNMKFLLDVSPKRLRLKMNLYPSMILGQLRTPLTGNRLTEDVPFAIDNGAFSKFRNARFLETLQKCESGKKRCLFVAMPDVVGSARRTLEAFDYWLDEIGGCGWPIALIAQDGQEDLGIPWKAIRAIFIGGSTEWKDSKSAYDIVKTAKLMHKHVHVGRVNDSKRFNVYEELEADTCDGTGVSIYTDKKLPKIIDRQLKFSE